MKELKYIYLTDKDKFLYTNSLNNKYTIVHKLRLKLKLKIGNVMGTQLKATNF